MIMNREEKELLLNAISDRNYSYIFKQLPFKLFNPKTKITYTINGVSLDGLAAVSIGQKSKIEEGYFGDIETICITEKPSTISFDNAISMWIASDATEKQIEWYKIAINNGLKEVDIYDKEHLYLLSKEEAWNAINHYVTVTKPYITERNKEIRKQIYVEKFSRLIDSICTPDGEINGHYVGDNKYDDDDDYY